MISNEEKVRAAIAEQAGEWFVANDEAPLDTRDSRPLRRGSRLARPHRGIPRRIDDRARSQRRREPIRNTPSRRF